MRFVIRRRRRLLRQNYWVETKAENGEILQTSEMLSSLGACHTNIQSMLKLRDLETIPIIDATK